MALIDPCAMEGCTVDPFKNQNDPPLHRISPKGSDFKGMCPRHYKDWRAYVPAGEVP